MYRVMLIVRKRTNSKKFKMKTTTLIALQALECSPYGNTAKSVEMAPVPVTRKINPSEVSKWGGAGNGRMRRRYYAQMQ
jgi:hypothetical protein